MWRSIRPGWTIVPGDILSWFTPYRDLGVGPPHNPVFGDPAIQFFPWLQFLGDALRAGSIPQWNPFILGGVPVTPNGFVSTWYPPFWIVRFLDPLDAYNVFVTSHLWWAALGCYAFARALGVRRFPAVVVGAAALAAGIWVHWSLHLVHLVGMVWLPWALAATHQVMKGVTATRVALLAIVFGLWWLGANPQYAYFGTLAMGSYALARLVQERAAPVRRAGGFAAGIALGALLAAPVLLPSAAIGDSILRDREPVETMVTSHLAPRELIRLVIADAPGNTVDAIGFRTNVEIIMDSPFFGLTALVLAGVGVVAGRGRARWALLGIALVPLALSVTGEPHRLLHALLPGYDRFRVAARWVSVVPAVAIPLAALGLDALLLRSRRASLGAAVSLSAAAGALGWWWLWQRSQPDAPHAYFDDRARTAALLLVAIAVAVALARRVPALTGLIVAGCVIFELATNTPRWYPTIRETTAYPAIEAADVARQRGGRVARAGPTPAMVSTFSSNVAMAYGIPDVQGQAVMFPRSYDRFLRLIADHDDWVRQTNVAPDLPVDTLSSPLLDVLDARTLLADAPVVVPDGFDVVSASHEPRLYDNPGARPATVVRRALPATEEEAWAEITDPSWDPDASSAVVGLEEEVEGVGGTVRSFVIGVDQERWEVSAPEGGLLRVGARHAEGWTATIDGEATDVLLADGIFRAVVVPPGNHVIRFRYRNPVEQAGKVAGGIGVLAIAALASLPMVRQARKVTSRGSTTGGSPPSSAARSRRQTALPNRSSSVDE